MIYLDNAATTAPKPKTVQNAVQSALTKYAANPGRSGYDTSLATAQMVYNCRTKLADFFGLGQPEQVMFTLNCTHAINYVIKGVVKRGGHVVTSELEHNAVMRPLQKLKEEQQVRVDLAKVSIQDEDQTVESFRALITSQTSLVVCTHASNVCGIALPIAKIGEICREKGVPFLVDAAQSAGLFPIHMGKMGIDYLCMPGHKGLYGPMGTGVLLAAREIPSTLIEGGTGNLSSDLHQPIDYPERMESGTINVPGIAGLSAGVDFVKAKGVDAIRTHEIKLLQKLYDGLSSMRQVILYLPRPDFQRFSPVLSFNTQHLSSTEMAQRYQHFHIAVRAGLQCAPSAHLFLKTIDMGTVRVSPSVFTRPEEIDSFLFATQKILNSL